MSLETLEDRSVPAVDVWTGGDVHDRDLNNDGQTTDPGETGNLRWSDPLNWSNGVPDSDGQIDAVVFPAFAPATSTNIENFYRNNGQTAPNPDAPNSVMDINVTISSLTIEGSGYEIVSNVVKDPQVPGSPLLLNTLRTLTILNGGIDYSGVPDPNQPAGYDGALGVSRMSFQLQLTTQSQTITVLNSTGTLYIGGGANNPGQAEPQSPPDLDPTHQDNISDAPGTSNDGLFIQGAGNLILDGRNSYDGLTTIATGMTLSVGTDTALGGDVVGTVVDPGATLAVFTANLEESLTISGTGSAFGGGAALTGGGGVDGGVALSPSATIGPITINGVVSGSGNLTTIIGVTLTNANTYIGTTTVQSGTLTITNNAALSPGNITTVDSGASLILQGDLDITTEQLFLNGNGVIDLSVPGVKFLGALVAEPGAGSSTGIDTWGPDSLMPGVDSIVLQSSASIGADQQAALVLTGKISGAPTSSLTKYGFGQAEFPIANPDFLGDTFIQNGIIVLPLATGLGPAAGMGGAITVESDLTNNINGSLLLSGAFAMQKNITINGGGYTGLDPALLLPPGVGFISGQGAVRTYNPGGSTPTNIDWLGTVTIGSAGSPNNVVSSVWTDPNTTLTFDGIVGGAAGQNFQKIGAGLLNITQANTYLGTTSLRDGTTFISNGSALGATGANGGGSVTVSSGATLSLANALTVPDKVLNLSTAPNLPVNLQAGSGNSLWSGLVNILGNTGGEADLTITDPTGILTFNNVVSGDALMRKLGAGTLALTGPQANTFVGNLNVDQGTVQMGKSAGVNAVAGSVVVGEGVSTPDSASVVLENSQQIPNTQSVTVNSDGLFNLNNFNQTVGPLTIQGGDILTGTGTITLNANVEVLGSTRDSTIGSATSGGSISLGPVTRSFNFLPSAGVSLVASANPAQFGTNVTFTLTVSANAGQPNPTGTVTFFDGSTQIGTTKTLVGGSASVTINTLTVGSHTITAIYSGDGNYASEKVLLAQPVVINDPSINMSITSNVDPAAPGQTVKFSFQASATGGNSTPTGTVTFFLDGITQIGTAQTLAGGTASVSTSTIPVGPHTIVAQYSGDSTYSAGSVTLANLQVGIPATLTLNTNADPALVGSPVTFTFTALGTTGNPTPTGTVTFFDNGVALAGGTATLSGGVATYTTSALSRGTHAITAQYSGDTVLYLPGTVTLAPTQVVGTNALLAISSTANAAVQGSTVQFTVVANGTTGAPAPTGFVQFSVDGVPVGAPQPLVNQPGVGMVAALSSNSLGVGTHVITATYSGDNYYNSEMVTLNPTQSIIATPTPSSGNIGVIITSNNDSSESGQLVTFTFTAYPPSGGSGATGNVQFFNNGSPIGGPQALTVGAGAISTASVQTASLGVGTHTITAFYSGGNYGAGTFTMSPSQVVTNPITAALSSSSNTAAPNTPVTFTFTDTVPTGDPAAGGSVTFLDDGTLIGTPQSLSANGTASVTTSSLIVGTHTITAVYSGDGFYGPFTTTLAPTQIVGTPPAMVLNSNVNPATPASIVTFHFIASGNTGGPIPTGTVTFFDNGNQIGFAQTLSLGAASITTNSLTDGSHVITAQYSGDTNYASGTTVLNPNQVVVDTPSIQIRTSADPVAFGTAEVLTAIVNRGTGDPVTTGTVTFFDGDLSHQIGTAQNISAGGTASVTTSTLSVGTHSIIAVYSGDTNYQAEETIFANLVVQNVPPPLPPVSPPATTVGGAAPTLQTDAVISGGTGAGIIKGGVGQMFLNKVNTYSGPTTVNGANGSIVLGVNNALPPTSVTTITAGTLNVNGTTGSVADLSSAPAGTLALGGGNFTVGSDNTSQTIAGPITGSGNLVKVGSGSLDLTSNSPLYTGTTVVSSGTVFLDAVDPNSSAIVNSGATLGGNGTLGTLTVNTGGVLSPGHSPGIINSGPTTLAGGSQYVVQLNGTTPGTGYDQLNVTGNISLNASILSLSLGYTPTIGDSYTIITATGTVSGNFAGLLNNATITLGADVFRITYNTSSVVLTFIGFAATETLTSSANPTGPNQSVTYTATITPVGTGVGTPMGTVQFLDGTTPIGAPQALNGSGSASISDSFPTTGPHTITAVYTSTNNYFASNASITQSVVSPSTTTLQSLNPPSVVFGTMIGFIARVAGTPGGAIPTGTITFEDATTGAILAIVAVDATGGASFSTSSLTVGHSTIIAVYSGDSHYSASSGTVTQTVTTLERIAVGSGEGAPSLISVYDTSGNLLTTINPFDGYLGGIKVAVGDVTGDGVADIIVGAGPGAPGGHIKIYDGQTFQEISSFFAYPGFEGGVSVAAGDVEGKGVADIIIGTTNDNDHVEVRTMAGGEVMSFYAFGVNNPVGVTVGAGDVEGDGRSDVIVGSATGMGQVEVFQALTGTMIQSYTPFVGYSGGIFVAAGDVNGDGHADIIVGAATGDSHVTVFDGVTEATILNFIAYPGAGVGVHVGAVDLFGDGVDSVLTGPAGTAPHVKAYAGSGGLDLSFISEIPGQPTSQFGIYVAGGTGT